MVKHSSEFQVILIKDVAGVAATKSKSAKAITFTHTRTDEGHIYSPPPPTPGDNKGSIEIQNALTQSRD